MWSAVHGPGKQARENFVAVSVSSPPSSALAVSGGLKASCLVAGPGALRPWGLGAWGPVAWGLGPWAGAMAGQQAAGPSILTASIQPCACTLQLDKTQHTYYLFLSGVEPFISMAAFLRPTFA